MDLKQVNFLYVVRANERIPELSIDLFVEACNNMTAQIKKGYDLCNDNDETIDLNKLSKAYDSLATDDMSLSTNKAKKGNHFNQSAYDLCDDINLNVETVNLDKMTTAYNALVRDDMQLSIKDMQAIILNKFYKDIVNYDFMLKRFKNRLNDLLQAKSDNKEISNLHDKIAAANFDLNLLEKDYTKHDLFTFNDRIDDINSMDGYRDYKYRPIRYEDLAHAVFPNYPVKL